MRAVGIARRGKLARTVSQSLLLREPITYLRHAWLDRSGAAQTYRLRTSGSTVLVRHGSSDAAMFDEIFCSHVYLPPPEARNALADLGRPPRIVDLGANIGLFGVFALDHWPGASIVAVEPEAENFAVLEHCREQNAQAAYSWQLINAAAAGHAGHLRFVSGQGAESHEASPGEPNAVSIQTVDVLPLLQDADFAKIDIEGGEWAILADPRLAASSVRLIVVEHHGRGCPTFTPRQTAREYLEEAGFRVQAGGDDVVGVGTLWAWR